LFFVVTDSDWFCPLTIDAQPVNMKQAATTAPIDVSRDMGPSLSVGL
jgi:hypothetical protein